MHVKHTPSLLSFRNIIKEPQSVCEYKIVLWLYDQYDDPFSSHFTFTHDTIYEQAVLENLYDIASTLNVPLYLETYCEMMRNDLFKTETDCAKTWRKIIRHEFERALQGLAVIPKKGVAPSE